MKFGTRGDFCQAPTLDEAAQSACDELGIVWKPTSHDNQWHRLDAGPNRSDKGDASIKYFDDDQGGCVKNWKTDEQCSFFVADDKYTSLSEAEKAKRKNKHDEQRRQTEAEFEEMRRKAADLANKIWLVASVVEATHPYIAKKCVKNTPEIKELSIKKVEELLGYRPNTEGNPLSGRILVIPLKDINGNISSVQFIDENGTKYFLYNGRKAGCYFEMPGNNATVHICEGVATALSVAEAFPEQTVISAFDAGNLLSVTKAIRDKLPNAGIIICADDDWKRVNGKTGKLENIGRVEAGRAARAVDGRVAIPDFGTAKRPDNASDFNDLHQLCGLDAVRRSVEIAAEPKIDIDAEIRRLAELGETEAFRDKAAHAKRLGLTVSDFDKLLNRALKKIKDGSKTCPYAQKSDGIYYTYPTRDGDEAETRLTNFIATIIADITRDDGVEISHVFEIEAQLKGRTFRFPVPAAQFGGLSWVAPNLGAGAFVEAGMATRDRARVGIQRLSVNIAERHVYTHIGWRKIGGEWAYLHAGGAIGKTGALDGVEVSLNGKLADFRLETPPHGEELKAAIRASLRILDLSEDRVTFPALATVWRAPLGAGDFSLFLSGLTGVMKSELAALMQAHWGNGFHGKSLPAAWSSTANSLESQAFLAKDALFVIDDFIPRGSTADVARLHEKADRVLRAQGNNSGRGRCNPDGTPRPEKPPRGLIVATGEEIPAGHSLRARLFLVEMKPGGINLETLTELQRLASDGVFAATMAGFAQWMAGRYEQITERYRQDVRKMRETGGASSHLRTSDIVRALSAAWSIFLDFATEIEAIDKAQRENLEKRAAAAFAAVAEEQVDLQRESDPVARFGELLRSAIGSGRAHIAYADGRHPQHNPRPWGWRSITPDGWMPQGDCAGWLSTDGNDLLLEPDAAFRIAEKMVANGQSLGFSVQTLGKRLAERGIIRTETRGRKKRHRCRRTIAGKNHDVWVARPILIFHNDDEVDTSMDTLDTSENANSKSVHQDEAPNPFENTSKNPSNGHFGHFGHQYQYNPSRAKNSPQPNEGNDKDIATEKSTEDAEWKAEWVRQFDGNNDAATEKPTTTPKSGKIKIPREDVSEKFF